MMKGTVGSPVAAVMQESFGCAVANRFYQLLDDESDPFDILREAERRQQQRKKRDEAAAAASAKRAGAGGRAGGGKRESQKARKQPGSPPAPGGPPQPGTPAAPPPQRGEARGAAAPRRPPGVLLRAGGPAGRAAASSRFSRGAVGTAARCRCGQPAGPAARRGSRLAPRLLCLPAAVVWREGPCRQQGQAGLRTPG